MRNNVRKAVAASDGCAPPLPSPERIQELLFEAARLGRVDMIPALLHAGADIDATDAKGYTALILASYNGQDEATALLLQAGAAVDRPDLARGNTALMGVAFKGYSTVADLLLGAGRGPLRLRHGRQLCSLSGEGPGQRIDGCPPYSGHPCLTPNRIGAVQLDTRKNSGGFGALMIH